MAASLTPSIIVLALGAGALGFPDALRLLLLRDVAGPGRSPLLDIAVCAVAMAALTAYAMGTLLLARFVRKAGPGAGGHASARRTDPFARLTLAVSLGAAAAVFACLLVAAPGARGLALLCRRIVDGVVAGESESPVLVSVLVASAAAAVLACTARRRPLLRATAPFRGHGAALASTPTARLSVTITAQSAVAAFLLLLLVVASGRLYARRGGSLVGVSVAVAVAAAVVGASMILSRFTRNAAGAGGRAAPIPATTARRFGAPSLASLVSFVCLLLVTTTYATATHKREATGAEY